MPFDPSRKVNKTGEENDKNQNFDKNVEADFLSRHFVSDWICQSIEVENCQLCTKGLMHASSYKYLGNKDKVPLGVPIHSQLSNTTRQPLFKNYLYQNWLLKERTLSFSYTSSTWSSNCNQFSTVQYQQN